MPGEKQMTLNNDIPLDPTEFCLPQKGPQLGRSHRGKVRRAPRGGVNQRKMERGGSAEGLMLPGLGRISKKTPVLIVKYGKMMINQDT